ncbi:hypothetical protein HY214_02720 [Candidatus Roizmanbacteria bacterium]|nr:hypothetical protein [Candidatus Roizmanbacteria bacterium]
MSEVKIAPVTEFATNFPPFGPVRYLKSPGHVSLTVGGPLNPFDGMALQVEQQLGEASDHTGEYTRVLTTTGSLGFPVTPYSKLSNIAAGLNIPVNAFCLSWRATRREDGQIKAYPLGILDVSGADPLNSVPVALAWRDIVVGDRQPAIELVIRAGLAQLNELRNYIVGVQWGENRSDDRQSLPTGLLHLVAVSRHLVEDGRQEVIDRIRAGSGSLH